MSLTKVGGGKPTNIQLKELWQYLLDLKILYVKNLIKNQNCSLYPSTKEAAKRVKLLNVPVAYTSLQKK